MRVSGGGAKSQLWKQILADMMDQPACTINAEQGPAYGVSLLAAVGSGQFKNMKKRSLKATIEVVKKVPPGKPAVKTYKQRNVSRFTNRCTVSSRIFSRHQWTVKTQHGFTLLSVDVTMGSIICCADTCITIGRDAGIKFKYTTPRFHASTPRLS